MGLFPACAHEQRRDAGFCGESEVASRHYAFLVSDVEFDAELKPIEEAGIEFYADFDLAGPGEINHLYGGRGLYFHDPNGHLLDIIAQPYGPVPQKSHPATPHSHG
jgi:catechol 2,3-dioxygenase-like lactoylglutathione lyase family enzyme